MTALATRGPDLRHRLLPRRPEPDIRVHLATYGPLPAVRRRDRDLLAEIAASGLTGRGGAGFPTAAKLDAVGRHRRTRVIANGTEGEPASAKDVVLLTHNPHLVLDGLVVAAKLLGAREATIAVVESGGAADAIAAAIAERPVQDRPALSILPGRFIAGEESALVDALGAGPGLPTGRRPYAEGVLVQNVETLANLGLIARFGASWFRAMGTEAQPGTALATVTGAVAAPGVVELEFGATLGELWSDCGGLREPVDAVLIGGYLGRWVRADDDLPLTSAALKPRGAVLGARVVVALPRSTCGLREIARVVDFLGGESAGQCGPCVFGLRALGEALHRVAVGEDVGASLRRVARLGAQVRGRGACHHPDGTLGFVSSGLVTFADELARHRHGECSATSDLPVLPTPRTAAPRRR